MNREIKFRAWFKRDKRMVESWYEMIPGDHSYAIYPAVTLEGKFIGKSIYDNVGAHELDADQWVFMQFTGLKDKNGKEIYEGDIAQTEFNGNSAVVFWEGCFCFMREDGNGHIFDPKEIEIIGNIYSNPELLSA